MTTLLRKLTHKSVCGWGHYKDRFIGDILIFDPMNLVRIYYTMSRITFEENILDQLGISYEFRIEKPGSLRHTTLCGKDINKLVFYFQDLYNKKHPLTEREKMSAANHWRAQNKKTQKSNEKSFSVWSKGALKYRNEHSKFPK